MHSARHAMLVIALGGVTHLPVLHALEGIRIMNHGMAVLSQHARVKPQLVQVRLNLDNKIQRVSRAPDLPLPLGEGQGEGNDHGAHDLHFSWWRGHHAR